MLEHLQRSLPVTGGEKVVEGFTEHAAFLEPCGRCVMQLCDPAGLIAFEHVA